MIIIVITVITTIIIIVFIDVILIIDNIIVIIIIIIAVGHISVPQAPGKLLLGQRKTHAASAQALHDLAFAISFKQSL